MELALLIARILAEIGPEAVELILLLKKKDGTIAIIPVLNEADEQFEANIEKIKRWRNETQ